MYRQNAFIKGIKQFCRPGGVGKKAYCLYQAYQSLFKIHYTSICIVNFLASSELTNFAGQRCWKKNISTLSSVSVSFQNSLYINLYSRIPCIKCIKQFCRPGCDGKKAYRLYQAYQFLFKIHYISFRVVKFLVSRVSNNFAGQCVLENRPIGCIKRISPFSKFTLHQFVPSNSLYQA